MPHRGGGTMKKREGKKAQKRLWSRERGKTLDKKKRNLGWGGRRR